MVLPPTPETAAAFFGTFKCGAILLSMSVLYGDEGIRHRVTDSGAKVLVTDAANPGRIDPALVEHVLLIEDFPAGGDDTFTPEDTLADDPAQLYYSSGTTGLAKGILHAHRYLLAHEEFVYCHDVRDGELFHGMGEWAWAAGIAPLFGPWRLGAVQLVFQREGGFDPHQQLDVLSRHGATNVFTTPTAMRSMMGIADAGTRYPQQFRVVCSAGEPLNPEAIRWFREQYGVTVLDYYGLTESYPLVANFPFLEVREGSMGKPMPGWDVQILDEDERPVAAGRARGDLPARALQPALPARVLGQRGGDARRRSAGSGSIRRTPRRATRTATSGTRARRRRDHRGGLPDRAVRGGVGLPGASGGRGGGGGRLAGRAARQRRQGVHRRGGGDEPSDALADEIKAFVRGRLGAHAYPRRIEFTDSLPKTLTGKIRRIELRQREAGRPPARPPDRLLAPPDRCGAQTTAARLRAPGAHPARGPAHSAGSRRPRGPPTAAPARARTSRGARARHRARDHAQLAALGRSSREPPRPALPRARRRRADRQHRRRARRGGVGPPALLPLLS